MTVTRRFLGDLLVAGLFTALAFVPWMGAMSSQFGDLPARPSDAFSVVLVLAQTLPIAVRRRWPVASLVVIGVSWALYQVLAYPPQFGTVTLYLALYTAGAYQRRFRTVTAITTVTAYVVVSLLVHRLGSPYGVADFLVFLVLVSQCWVIGAYVRRYRADEVTRRHLAEAAAAAEERTRIARELHDVVTHHVTAMVVQADVAQLVPQRDDAPPALQVIGDTGRRALSDLRALLEVLEEPRSVRELVEHNTPPATLTEELDPRTLPPALQLVVYRVVQEGLTNAAKYAAGQPTAVRIARDGDTVEVEVTNVAGTPVEGLSGGRGLSGLRERVAALGGTVTPEVLPDGGFRLCARIPA
ncbi:sensor histidine kinase [Lentzea fradiae]|uniref:sensor histidine kinase n=1 Tax=Lentzea fradiae TaxID=200378 RepID=UPI001FE114A8|nr:histidine kinase [Lentzea fradiae]